MNNRLINIYCITEEAELYSAPLSKDIKIFLCLLKEDYNDKHITQRRADYV